MSLFDFLLSLLLVLNPGISEADFNNVYSVLDDTAIHSIVVEDSVLDRLSQLADGAVMPLDFTSSDSSNLNSIRTAVEAIRSALGGSSSSTIWSRLDRIADLLGNNTVQTVQYLLNSVNGHVAAVNSALTFGNDSIQSLLSDFRSYFGNSYGGGTKTGYPSMTYDAVNSILAKLNSSSSAGGWDVPLLGKFFDVPSGDYVSVFSSPYGVFVNTRNVLLEALYAAKGGNIWSFDNSVVTITKPMGFAQLFGNFSLALRKNLVASSGWSYIKADSSVSTLSSDMPFVEYLANSLLGLRSNLRFTGQSLGMNGWDVAFKDISFPDLLRHGMTGLSRQLVGSDYMTTFSFLQEDIKLPAQSVTTGNILDALGIMGTQLQNPLQKLAFVFANPLDLEIRENVEDNMEEANDGFFKPDSDGSVKGSDIKDAAGITSGLKDSLSSPVSVGDLFSQFGSDSNFLYYSEQTRADLDTVSSPVVVSEDPMDDYQWIYDLDSDGDGYVSFYDSNALTDFLKGG